MFATRHFLELLQEAPLPGASLSEFYETEQERRQATLARMMALLPDQIVTTWRIAHGLGYLARIPESWVRDYESQNCVEVRTALEDLHLKVGPAPG